MKTQTTTKPGTELVEALDAEATAMAPKVSGLALLREPFPAHQISKLPKGGIFLDYVGHAALTDRLLDADKEWNWEPLALDAAGLPALDANGGLWIRLTVDGLTRLGYGHAGAKKGGDAIKELIGDALRNAAMRFGAALDLWHKGDLHLDADVEPVTLAPDGYAEWLVKFTASAKDGYKALSAEWTAGGEACRNHYTATVGKAEQEKLRNSAHDVDAQAAA